MADGAEQKTRYVTSILLEAGVVTAEQVEAALERKCETGLRIGETLVELGMITEEDIGWALARQLGIAFVDVDTGALDHDLVRSFPEGLLFRLHAIPLVRTGEALSVALADPTDREAIEELRRIAGCPIVPCAATPSAIRRALGRILGEALDPQGAALGRRKRQETLWDGSGAAFLLGYLDEARKRGASAIHFVPASGEIEVYCRAGGKLARVATEPGDAVYCLLARLDALGGPSIDGQGLHASGRVDCPFGDGHLALDVSLLNCAEGVSATLTLSAATPDERGIEGLGFDPVDLARIRAALDRPAGLILIAGPPGSGVSTTLASMLSAIDLRSRRALVMGTRTWPAIPGVTQVVSAAEDLESQWAEIVFRQDVDVVAIDDGFSGEGVREALSSAGLGRLLLARTDWTDTFALLEFLAADPRVRSPLSSRLELVVQQRLVHVETAGSAGEEGGGVPGSRCLFEVLCVSEPMRAALREGATAGRLRALAAADGLVTLSERVRRLVEEGVIGEGEAARAAC